MVTSYIHPTAKVHDSVVMGPGVWIGPQVLIGPDVVIGAYSVIGGGPEHRDFYTDKGLTRCKGVLIGCGVRIFEFVSIHSGTKQRTTVMNYSAVQNHSHLGHDCQIGHNVTIGGTTTLAGHVCVMDNAVISGRVAVHQKCVIGAYAMLGAGSILRRHQPPGETWIGSPARMAGMNEIGLKRGGVEVTLEKEEQGGDSRWEGYLKGFDFLVARSGLKLGE